MRRPHQLALLLFIAFGAWSASHVETLVAQVAAPPETPRFEVVLNNVYLAGLPSTGPAGAHYGRRENTGWSSAGWKRGISRSGQRASHVEAGRPGQRTEIDVRMRNLVVGSVQRRMPRAVTSFTLTYTFGTRDDLDGSSTAADPQGRRPAKCFDLPARKPAVGQTLPESLQWVIPQTSYGFTLNLPLGVESSTEAAIILRLKASRDAFTDIRSSKMKVVRARGHMRWLRNILKKRTGGRPMAALTAGAQGARF